MFKKVHMNPFLILSSFCIKKLQNLFNIFTKENFCSSFFPWNLIQFWFFLEIFIIKKLLQKLLLVFFSDWTLKEVVWKKKKNTKKIIKENMYMLNFSSSFPLSTNFFVTWCLWFFLSFTSEKYNRKISENKKFFLIQNPLPF